MISGVALCGGGGATQTEAVKKVEEDGSRVRDHERIPVRSRSVPMSDIQCIQSIQSPSPFPHFDTLQPYSKMYQIFLLHHQSLHSTR